MVSGFYCRCSFPWSNQRSGPTPGSHTDLVKHIIMAQLKNSHPLILYGPGILAYLYYNRSWPLPVTCLTQSVVANLPWKRINKCFSWCENRIAQLLPHFPRIALTATARNMSYSYTNSLSWSRKSPRHCRPCQRRSISWSPSRTHRTGCRSSVELPGRESLTQSRDSAPCDSPLQIRSRPMELTGHTNRRPRDLITNWIDASNWLIR